MAGNAPAEGALNDALMRLSIAPPPPDLRIISRARNGFPRQAGCRRAVVASRCVARIAIRVVARRAIASAIWSAIRIAVVGVVQLHRHRYHHTRIIAVEKCGPFRKPRSQPGDLKRPRKTPTIFPLSLTLSLNLPATGKPVKKKRKILFSSKIRATRWLFHGD